MSDFKKLKVWRKAHALSLNVHRASRTIRGAEYVSLRSQLIRSAMSVPANLVEGSGQRSRRQFGRFIGIALDSARELEYHLMVARDINALKGGEADSLISQNVEIKKMLHGLQQRVLSTPGPARKQVNAAPPDASPPVQL